MPPTAATAAALPEVARADRREASPVDLRVEPREEPQVEPREVPPVELQVEPREVPPVELREVPPGAAWVAEQR